MPEHIQNVCAAWLRTLFGHSIRVLGKWSGSARLRPRCLHRFRYSIIHSIMSHAVNFKCFLNQKRKTAKISTFSKWSIQGYILFKILWSEGAGMVFVRGIKGISVGGGMGDRNAKYRVYSTLFLFRMLDNCFIHFRVTNYSS